MAKRNWKTKQCPRCEVTFGTCENDKYCKDCRKDVKAELRESGFLQKTYTGRVYRSPEKRQATSDDPGPWAENAIRSMEGD